MWRPLLLLSNPPRCRMPRWARHYTAISFKDYLQVTGDPSYTSAGVSWQKTGTLPAGMSFGADGRLTGTPTQAGTFAFSVEAAYKTKTSTQNYSLTAVNPFGTPAKLSYGLAFPGTTWTNDNGATGSYGAFTDVGITHGKWYAEITLDDNYSANQYPIYEIGITNIPATSITRAWFAEVSVSNVMGAYIHPSSTYFCSYTHCGPNGTNVGGVLSAFNWLKGDVFGLAIDADNNSITWYRNGVQIYKTSNITTSKPWYVGATSAYKPSSAGGGLKFNFGQSAFAFTVPSGYAAGIGSAAGN